jgi:signal peptidase I
MDAASNASEALKCELASEVLRVSDSLRLPATGWSMLPTVWPGDTLVIERVSSEDVFEGDLVMFSSGRRFVAHRVVAKGRSSAGSRIQTQGDAVPLPDCPVAESDLLGKVSFILRNGKCIEPTRRLRFSKRALAAVFRRAPLAARIVARVHRLRRNLQSQSQPQIPQVQTEQVQTL